MSVNIEISRLEPNTGQIPGLPKNPRFIRDQRFEALKQSIADLPDMLALRELLVYPIPDTDHFVIIGGNMRFRACKDLKFKQLPCKIIPAEYDAAKLREIAIKDNVGFGDNDNDILANEWDLGELVNWGMELDWDIPTGDDDGEITEDNFNPDDPVEPRVHKGEIWQLGEHRLMCGDCQDEHQLSALMLDDRARCVFTDPPYGYQYQSHKRTKTEKFDIITNDDKMIDFIPNVQKYNDGFLFVCTAFKVLAEWMSIFKKHCELSNMIIWDKGGGGIGDLKKTFCTDYEIILCSHNGAEITGKRIGSVWRVNKDGSGEYIHPTQKPIGISGMAIENTTHAGDVVLDVFGGSGSTLMACEQLKRKCRMMEIDEHYCDVIVQRWEKYTGKTAVKLYE